MIGVSVYAQDTRKQDLSDLAQKFKDSLDYSGVFLVANGTTILLEKAYGYANMEHTVKNTINTKFRIASISKMFVSYAIFILADKKEVDFNESIEKYFPSLKKEFSKQITIKHLITHSSGLTRDIDILSPKSSHENYTEEEFITILNSTNLQSTPGKSYSYSNVGFSLLGRIIEKATKKNFNEAMSQLIFKPLKLKNTGHEIEGHIVADMANGYNAIGEELFKSSHENKSHVFAAGSMYSNAKDLLLFAKEVIDGDLISDKMHKLYLKSGGWVTWKYSGNLNNQKSVGQFLMHSGSCPGYRATIGLFLEDNTVVIGLSNKVPINTALIYNKLGNIAVGLEPEELFKPHIIKLTPDIINGKFKSAIEKYDQLLKSNPNNEKMKVGELNTMGYLYLEYNKTKEAINFFKFATMLFPKNSNAFDSLGEALIKDGQGLEGVQMYEQSLKLNSKNENAKAAIKQFKNGNTKDGIKKFNIEYQIIFFLLLFTVIGGFWIYLRKSKE